MEWRPFRHVPSWSAFVDQIQICLSYFLPSDEARSVEEIEAQAEARSDIGGSLRCRLAILQSYVYLE
jgi:hypothetical protein